MSENPNNTTGRVASKADYGSTVEGRDVPTPVPPNAAHEGGSAARSDDGGTDASSEGDDAPTAIQESLLDRCPACGSDFYAKRGWVPVNGENVVCMDEWHRDAEIETARERATPTMSKDIWYYYGGPMSGYPDYNYPQFATDVAILREAGLKIKSPHEIPWPENHKDMAEDELWFEMMERTRKMMLQCQAGIFMKGWPQSRGARQEMKMALDLGWKIYFYHDYQIIDMNKEQS